MTEEIGPIYNVPLIDTLPLGSSGGMMQQMPSRHDLQECSKRFMRVVAGYEVLLAHYQRAMSKIGESLKVAAEFGGTDGAHHKDWVIDQMVRELTGDGYDAFVSECCKGDAGPDSYSWEVGIAP